jgi:hypothetical protein
MPVGQLQTAGTVDDFKLPHLLLAAELSRFHIVRKSIIVPF